ncbi:hypothetical protein [Aeromonas veronii]|uniref:hypothetical protein n=1 Tax=Aeromonas veronii TaxID=654 RepID=UPI001119745B|nr:hypothetical protein [Aeromonas veronii]TNI11189.1 hypothetical protein CF106_15615 [Aeromonas veronii]
MTSLKIINNTATSAISIQELASFLDENVDFSDSDSIRESASQFGRLFLNKNLIKDYIICYLNKELISFGVANSYTPPSIVLYNSDKYIIRANLWRAVDQYEESDINLYGLAHDHNFDFLTLNFYGPGYTSNMYTYDYGNVIGRINEKVELKENGILSLKEGEMFLYRKNIDIHSQLPPRSDSITINLMAKLPLCNETRQYIFDIERSVISKVYGGFYARRFIFDMAALLGDLECDELLRTIHMKTDCTLSREYLSQLLIRSRTEP